MVVAGVVGLRKGNDAGEKAPGSGWTAGRRETEIPY